MNRFSETLHMLRLMRDKYRCLQKSAEKAGATGAAAASKVTADMTQSTIDWYEEEERKLKAEAST